MKYNYEEVSAILEEVINKFYHHNIISGPRILGVENINELTYSIRIVCETESYQYFEISRLLKKDIVQKFNETGIEYFESYIFKKSNK